MTNIGRAICVITSLMLCACASPLSHLPADCQSGKPGAFESADAFAKSLLDRDAHKPISREKLRREIACMLSVYALRPERNNVYRCLAGAPVELANEVAAAQGRPCVARLMLLRFDAAGENADVAPLFALQYDEVEAAALSTLWKMSLRNLHGGPAMLASAVDGRSVRNILVIERESPQDATVRSVYLTRERFFCFDTPYEDAGGWRVTIARDVMRIWAGPMRDPLWQPMRTRLKEVLQLYGAPAPISGLAVLKVGDQLKTLTLKNHTLPDWFKEYVPDELRLNVEYVKSDNQPAIIKPAATQPAYIKPDVNQ